MPNPAGFRRIALGMIGCGMIADFHGKALRQSEDASGVFFSACADVRLEAARSFAARFGCHGAYDDMIRMVREEALDGVVLATWPTQHFEHVKRLVDAGVKYILIEKPLTVRAADALALWRHVRERSATVVEGWMFRHHPVMEEHRRLVRSGTLGRIDTIHSSYQGYDPEAAAVDAQERNWRQKQELGGGVAYDLTSYCALACTGLAGSLPRRAAFFGETSKYGTLVRLHGRIEFANGVVALIQSSKRARVTRTVAVNGEHGAAAVSLAFGPQIPGSAGVELRTSHDPLVRNLEVVYPQEADGGRSLLDPGIAQRRQLESFANTIRGAEPPAIPLAESVVNVYVVEAMVRSAVEQRPIDIELPPEIVQALPPEPRPI